MTIIHISGASGSGKSFLGDQLKAKFGNKIVVKDIDALRMDFIKKHYRDLCGDPPCFNFGVIDKAGYQVYIDDFVKKHTSKPLVFVGLNHMPWWHKNHYYDMHSTEKYFIDLDDKTLLKQKCKRLLLECANSEEDMKYLIDNNEKYIKNVSNALAEECNLKKTIKSNNKLRKDYRKQGHEIMSREDIFKHVSNRLKS